MKTYEGILLLESTEEIETVLSLPYLTEIEWIVNVSVYGKNSHATYNDQQNMKKLAM